jgi:hypothetical protein
MQILRILSVTINNNSSIDVSFTENLTSNLVPSNISIISDTPNVPSSEVLFIRITGNVLSFVCQPLTPLASYFIKLSNTPTNPFISLNGDAKISEDGVSNMYLITGPLSSDNPVKNFFLSYFKDNIYDLEDSNGLVAKYIDSLSVSLARALYDIGQTKNENYLSFTVTDEQKTRGPGPFDRLNEESAYEIFRVGRGATTANASTAFVISDFPAYPITLQKQDNIEVVKPNTINQSGYFNINSLIFNLSTLPITKVNSIVFTQLTANPIYVYDIENFGYQIKNSRYDQDFAFDYLVLEENQIKISDKILEDSLFSLDNILSVEVKYESKDLGRVVDSNTVIVTTVKKSIREVLPPIINIFNLKHAPITDTSGIIINLGGVIFTDPNTTTGLQHPAFITELPFRLNGLPFLPGQYSIDYTTGNVYVYGADLTNDGTGAFPPLATYNYLLTYKHNQDYTYDPDLLDVVSLPHGNLRNSSGTVKFNYEQVLIPGIDYVANLHQEVLTERINNNLLAANLIKTQSSPITNVYRIYNETSGEIYTLDRWSDNKIYFRYNTPPRIDQKLNERVSFNTVTNELLFVNSSQLNNSFLNIVKIFLNNNTIISGTEDSVATSFNTSLTFSDNNIFIKEKWFNRQLDESINIDRLESIGEYMIDYFNGVVYCVVVDPQNFNIGTVSYKNNTISPQFPHLISVDDLYYQINILDSKTKTFTYTSFGDGFVIPESLDYADELTLNNSDAIYQIHDDQIGIFMDGIFIPGVTNQIKYVRSLIEYEDLLNSTNPLNFASFVNSGDFDVQIEPIIGQSFENVQFDGNYYVVINQNIPYLSNNITYAFTVTRVSDSATLWNGSGTVIPGDVVKLVLPGINAPNEGDLVNVTFTFTINDLSRIVIDYNKGEYYIDYVYVADEIIVSYEHGDNVLDFRKSKNLPTGSVYYVTYKVGALRDALLKNFGTLVNIPELANFDINFDRERYRDALIAALSSFIQGPTITAIKNIGQTISHIEPEVIESVFQEWSLGSSLLNPTSIKTKGDFQLLPAKFDNGVLIDSTNQTINFPFNSNIRLEEGTFETWISSQWNGLDNDALLTFNILKDGYAIDPSNVFIGTAEAHPEIINGSFSISKLTNMIGSPNKNKDGVFIYYDTDLSGTYLRWYVEIIDGYVSPISSNYKFKITATGSFYDTKSIVIPKPSNLTIFTGTSTVNFNIIGGGQIDEGITFVSDVDHYILDVGEDKTKNRISLFKDISGYLNFRVYDKNKTPYTISSDVSNWKSGDLHHIAVSWKLNTRNGRDEMHLFVDGFEIPNIIKYGQKLRPYLHEKFRTINPEEIIGSTNIDIVSSTDLLITAGNDTVSSSVNFSAYNIFAGDTIYIDELGFSDSGYTIISINGQNLVLSQLMPVTLSNGRFSVNRTKYEVVSDIDVSPNITVSTIHAMLSGTDLIGNSGNDTVMSPSINFTNDNIVQGYLLKIDDTLITNIYTIVAVNGNTLTINDNLPTSISSTTFRIYSNVENELPGVRALEPAYSISKDNNFNNVLTLSSQVFAGDLILIKTLGLNHRKIKQNYYVWSDGVENILMTNLPPPISLDEANITRIITPTTVINSSNSTLSGGVLHSNNLDTAKPSNSQNGRTISVTISGTNIDFTIPVQVTINGVSGINTISETIIFNDYGTLDFTNLYLSLNYVNINVKPTNTSKSACTITVKEKYSITHAESSGYAPVVKFSYQIGYGYTLYNSGINSVTDDSKLFSALDVNNYLVISSPVQAAGFYKITSVSQDRKTLFIDPTSAAPVLPIPSFDNGVYQILQVNSYRSGLQNGFFTFEVNVLPSQAYYLDKGFYELEYFTYTRIGLDPINNQVFLGSDYTGHLQLHGLIDQVKIYSTMLTDTRIGESIPENQRSITKDFNSLKSLSSDATTLMLIDFNTFPFKNVADFYVSPSPIKKHFYSSLVVNENFGNSLVMLEEPLIISNDGVLNTRKEGTLEFWVNPLFDTCNDPHKRFYFDAYGAITEEIVSVNNVSLKLSSPASQILSVKIKNGDSKLDYFAGGKIEIDTQNAIQEQKNSIGNSAVLVSKPILQVITIKIIGDLTDTDYFANGAISSDMQIIYLGKILPSSNLPLLITYQTAENENKIINTQIIRLNKKLPYQKSHVVVNYIPKGLQGDRIAIFKDEIGYLNFAITASGKDYVIGAPTYWARDTWHKVKASFIINSGINKDEMRLFIDGYIYNNVVFGSDLIAGTLPAITGSVTIGDGYGSLGSIKFKDSINEVFIGAQYDKQYPIFSLLDNFRISSVSRPIYAPYGEPLDVGYSSNLDMVFPVTEDLYTTYLLNSDAISFINDDFATIRNRRSGLFDFSVNIIDSLGIVNSSIKSKEALEKLIKVLKPANSRAFIQYIK